MSDPEETTPEKRWATPKKALLALLALIAFSVYFFAFGPLPRLAEIGDESFVFDLRGDYDAEDAALALDSFGREGRALYWRYLGLDLVFMTLNALAAALLIALAAPRLAPSGRLRHLVWLPPAIALLDLAEDAGIAAQLQAFPQALPNVAETTATITSVKLAIAPLPLLLAVGMWLAVAAMAIARKLRRGSQ